jgi:hypothetical protein
MIKRILITALMACLTGCHDVTNGEKIGTIVKIAQEGFFNGTWEAELIRGGMNSGSGSFGSPFYFTVPTEEMVKQIQNAMDSQKQIKVHYHQTLCLPWNSGSHCTFAISAEVIK